MHSIIFITLNQCAHKKRIKRKTRNRVQELQKKPQKKGMLVKNPTIRTPRKPCSARRTIAYVQIVKKKAQRIGLKWRLKKFRTVMCYIPGKGTALKKFNVVLIRGGGPNDLPEVKYSIIRGSKDDVLLPELKNRRSKYGIIFKDRFVRKRATPKKLLQRVKKRGIGVNRAELTRKGRKEMGKSRNRKKLFAYMFLRRHRAQPVLFIPGDDRNSGDVSNL